MLPCLDEADALPWVLDRIPEGARAIVVDNGSTDGSGALARRLGATLVESRTRGYGAACHAGLLAATAPYVAFCDCDGSLDPRDVLRLAATLTAGADLAICRRRPTTRAAFPAASRVANLELARQVRKRCGAAIRDVGPMRIAPRTALLTDGLWRRHFRARSDIVGQSIALDGVQYQVIGVLPRPFVMPILLANTAARSSCSAKVRRTKSKSRSSDSSGAKRPETSIRRSFSRSRG